MSDDAQRLKLIETYRARLNVLDLQRAAFGENLVPTHIVTEIDDVRRALAGLEAPRQAAAAPDDPASRGNLSRSVEPTTSGRGDDKL
jgi:hypothetical protein